MAHGANGGVMAATNFTSDSGIVKPRSGFYDLVGLPLCLHLIGHL